MAIQKFKYGQEITSAKLNEIVSFLNSLEFNLSRVEYWNANVDNSLVAFQEQLNAIKTQVNELLASTENFDILATNFTNILSQYYALIEDNVEPLLENFFGGISITAPNAQGESFWVFGNQVTTHLAGVKGDTGNTGPQGATGEDGKDAVKVYVTQVFDSAFNNLPFTTEGGDIAFRTSDWTLWKKQPMSQGGGWIQQGTTFKGDTGLPGNDGNSTSLEFEYYNTLSQSTPDTIPTSNTKYLRFRTFRVKPDNTRVANSESEWQRIQIRTDRYIPIINETAGTLQWVLDEGQFTPSLDTYNIIGPQGPKGDKGDSGNEFVVKGLKANTGSLPVTGSEGDAWFVGTSQPYDVYIWDVGLTTPSWVNVGPLQGATGATGAPGDTGPTGATGPRGSRIFAIETGEVENVVTGTTFLQIQLILNDIFIEEETGNIKQVDNIDSVNNTTSFAIIYTLPSVHENIFDDAQLVPIEAISKGDVIQFVGIKNSKKLVAKATPFNGVSITYQSISYPIANVNNTPELIMGVAGNDVVSGGNGLQIYSFGYIKNYQPSYLSFLPDENAILYFDSETTVNRGRLTKTEPDGDYIKVVCAIFLGDNQDTLLVRIGHSYVVDDIKGLTTELESKAPLLNPTFSGTVNGITKSMVGLAEVNNTSDVNKPISTATQAALNLKANLSGANFSGVVTGITPAAASNDTTFATTAFVKTNIMTQTYLGGSYANGVRTITVSDIDNFDYLYVFLTYDFVQGEQSSTTQLFYVPYVFTQVYGTQDYGIGYLQLSTVTGKVSRNNVDGTQLRIETSTFASVAVYGIKSGGV